MNKLHPYLLPAKDSCPFLLYGDHEDFSKCTFWELHLGLICLERVPNDGKHFLLKSLVARLRVRGFQLKGLCEIFPYSENTVRLLAKTLRGGDIQAIIRVFGLHGRGKIPPEINSYIRYRYWELKQVFGFRKKIIGELFDIFQLEVSGEALRLIFRKIDQDNEDAPISEELPNSLQTEPPLESLAELIEGTLSHPKTTTGELPENCAKTQQTCERPLVNDQKMRKSIEASIPRMPLNSQQVFHAPQELHHLGLVLFMPLLLSFQQGLSKGKNTCLQVLAQLLLGCQNIEQGKGVCYDSLNYLIGPCVTTRQTLRDKLSALSGTEFIAELIRLNISILKLDMSEYLYIFYDPHGKVYCGQSPLMKGWIGRVKETEKVLYSDYLHSRDGHPIFMKHYDNFYDLRERILLTIKEFCQASGADASELNFVIDRGIYGQEAMSQFLAAGSHLITWEKNYQTGAWDDTLPVTHFNLSRLRNHAADKLISSIVYQEQTWAINEDFRRIIVRVTDPRGKTNELSILCSNPDTCASEAVELMLTRWLQENDFKYLRNHFGIDQIDSYKTIPYEKIADSLDDRMIESRAFYQVKKELANLKNERHKLINKKHNDLKKQAEKNQNQLQKRSDKLSEKLLGIADITDPEHSERAFEKIRRGIEKSKELQVLNLEKLAEKKQEFNHLIHLLDEKISMVEDEKDHTLQQESRLQAIIDQGYCIFDTGRKSVLDMLRIIGRNIFYETANTFREVYNDFRDDHVILRSIAESSGKIRVDQGVILIELWIKPCFTKSQIERIKFFFGIIESRLPNEFKPVIDILPTIISIKRN